MSAAEAKSDPLGIQPQPEHGLPIPDLLDDEHWILADIRLEAARRIWVEHPPQEAIIRELLRYARRTVKRRGCPLEGVRLDEESNAGKSATMQRLIEVAGADMTATGLAPNPHLIVYVELDRSTSVRTFFRAILKELGDEFWHDPRAETDELEDRIEEFTWRLGTILLIGDEIQHLDRKSVDATGVQDRLKTFCNRGIVPVALIGDETSPAFFDKNPKFAARFETRLALKPLDFRKSTGDRKLFLEFLRKLDTELVDCNATTVLSGLGTAGIRTPLGEASSGHIGRVVRIVRHALKHALSRKADRIEAHDLSVAVRDYAMGLGWIGHDPFSKISSRRG